MRDRRTRCSGIDTVSWRRKKKGGLPTWAGERRGVCGFQISGDSCLSPGSAPRRRQGPRQVCLHLAGFPGLCSTRSGAVGDQSCAQQSCWQWVGIPAGLSAGQATPHVFSGCLGFLIAWQLRFQGQAPEEDQADPCLPLESHNVTSATVARPRPLAGESFKVIL